MYITTNNEKRDSLVKYHLKQSLGLMVVTVVFNIALTILSRMVTSLSFLGYFGYAFLILWIFGLINAINAAEKPIPVIGKMFEDKFGFIK